MAGRVVLRAINKLTLKETGRKIFDLPFQLAVFFPEKNPA